MKTLIRKILREQFEYKQQLFDLLRTGDDDNIEMVKILSQGQDINILELLIEYFKEGDPPYFKLLKHFNLSEEELNYILSGIFGKPVKSYYQRGILDENGNQIYFENSNNTWTKSEYDENGNQIYLEHSKGGWFKKEYDDNGNRIYFENSDGFWEKLEYDEYGIEIYWENSDGYIKDNR